MDTRRIFIARMVCALTLFVILMIGEYTYLRGVNPSLSLYIEFGGYALAFLIAGYDVCWKAIKRLIHREFLDEHFLMMIASLGAFSLVLFPESDPHMAEGAAVMIFYQIGEFFQDIAVDSSRNSIKELMDMHEELVEVITHDGVILTHAQHVKIGSLVRIKPGERVALDGIVIEGTSAVDTAALTGEALAQSVEVGQNIYSGSINLSAPLTIRTTVTWNDSTIQKILELVEEAQARKAHVQSFVSRIARLYTPLVVIAAVCIALIPIILHLGTPHEWILRGLIFLVVSCPCALVISVPLSFFSGIGAASRKGVLIKGAHYIELLAKIKTIIFDKTGTITTGSCRISSVKRIDTPETTSYTNEEILIFAAALERMSTHPLARAVCAAAPSNFEQIQVANVEEIPGKGIMGIADGIQVAVGSAALFAQEHIAIPTSSSEAKTLLYIALDGVCYAILSVEDNLKEEAQMVCAHLKQQGISLVMLSGDHAQTAQKVADLVGIDRTYGGLLPAEKATYTQNIATSIQGTCAFVGDGINDAPSLKTADIGIAMGALGSDAAIEAADVVLMHDRLSGILDAIHISKKTMRIVWQNIILALGIKIVIMILAAVGYAPMWLGVFGDVGVAILAILNALRFMLY